MSGKRLFRAMTLNVCRHSGPRAGIHFNSRTSIYGFRIKSGVAIFLLIVYLFTPSIYAGDFNYKGHIKGQFLSTSYPSNSLFLDTIDNPSSDQNADLRLNFALHQTAWSWQADYQLLGKHGDSLMLPTGITPASQSITTDDNRLMDLTEVFSEGNQTIVAHRLDRLHLTYSTERVVLRIGRQAVSWGNGLVYNPMDFFNPFDPASIDKEYKNGDDMLYSQFSFDSGDDLQAVWVLRRDDDGNSTSEVSSIAARYHLFLSDYEIDFLLSEHYDNQIVGIGGVFNVGGSVWRGDILSTETDSNRQTSAVLNASYSWIASGRNMSGHIEIYRNASGIDNGDYSPASLAQHPELVSRIKRGELFTLARQYLAASATIELKPLWLLTTTLFANLDDDSKLIQLVSQHDLEQNLQLLIAVSIPNGDEGSEFGGIDSGVPGRPLSVDGTFFAQLAFYF